MRAHLSWMLLMACQEAPLVTSGTTVVEAPPEVDAVSPDVVVDEVVQATPEQIDVLWVVDDSGSMANEQTLLALEFPRFMQLVLDSHADVHIGVVTTDASGAEGGALEQAAAFRWVTPDTPNPVGTFREMVEVGTGGSAFETGRRAAWLALSPPLTNTLNQGFRRDAADLHIIFVSDEEDNSGQIPTQQAFLEFLAPDSDGPLIQTHAITGLPPVPSCGIEPGSEYVALAEATGGTSYSLCSEDWAPIIESLGLTASGLVRDVFLSQLPRPGTLRVEIEEANGFVWDGVDDKGLDPCESVRCTPYVYDATSNGIRLTAWVPPEGAIFRMTYEALGGS